MSFSSKVQLGFSYRLFKVLARSPAAVLPPVPLGPIEVKPTRIKTIFPEINLTKVSLPAIPPRVERSFSRHVVREAVRRFGRVSHRVDENAPVYPGDPNSWIDRVLESEVRNLIGKNRAVVRPTCCGDKAIDIGALVGEGPFFMFLKRCSEKYTLDLSSLSSYEHHPYCHDTGSTTDFVYDENARRLIATRIVLNQSGEVIVPGDSRWHFACRIVGTGLVFSTIVGDHATDIHLGLAANVANSLYAMPSHPIKRLIWPHVYGVININDSFLPILLDRAPVGSFWNFFSFTETGLYQFVEKQYSEFELRKFNPRHGNGGLGLAKYFPKSTFADAVRLWQLLSEYVDAYVDLYYSGDADLDTDVVLQAFLNRLRSSLPNGKSDLAGNGKTECKRLLTEIIFGLSVRHHISASMNWNFLVHPEYLASQLPKDRPYINADRFRLAMIALLGVNVPARLLMHKQNYRYMDLEAIPVVDAFLEKLERMNQEMTADALDANRIYPKYVRVATET